MAELRNPFVPFTGAEPPHFVGRAAELRHFEKALDSTRNGAPAHVAFLGGYGMGKTILLKKCRELAIKKACKAISTKMYETDDPKAVVNMVISKAYEAIPQPRWKKFRERLSSIGVQVVGSGINIGVKELETEPQTTLELALMEIYAQADTPLVITMDDLQEIKKVPILALLRNALIALSERGAKVALVVSGTEDLLRPAEPHHPITRFFMPKFLNPLSPAEIREAIEVPLKACGVKIEDEALETIIALSQGNPFYVQTLGYHFFEHRKGHKINASAIDLGLADALNEMAHRMYDKLYERASPAERKVLAILYEAEGPLLAKEIRERAARKGLRAGSIHPMLSRLNEKGLIRQIRDPSSPYNGAYAVRDELFKHYLLLKRPLEYNARP